jgi:hypothetical protein
MDIERRALYNLLHLHWLADPNLEVEPWQVENYRALPLENLFQRLAEVDIQLDKISFVAYADECDSPEDLTEHLVGDRELETRDEDQIYLLLFELWRRLMSEKPSVSIVCNELDYAITLYDANQLTDPVLLQNALANFLAMLDENADAGIEPKEAFKLISTYCANDIETFLYDFISEQIEAEQETYAQELLEALASYLENNKWFLLLRIRLLHPANPKLASRLLSQLIEDHVEEADLEFNLELLAFMPEIGTAPLLRQLVVQTVPLLQGEEDFQDLLAICIDYMHRSDQEANEQALQKIANQQSLKQTAWNEADLKNFLAIIQTT